MTFVRTFARTGDLRQASNEVGWTEEQTRDELGSGDLRRALADAVADETRPYDALQAGFFRKLLIQIAVDNAQETRDRLSSLRILMAGSPDLTPPGDVQRNVDNLYAALVQSTPTLPDTEPAVMVERYVEETGEEFIYIPNVWTHYGVDNPTRPQILSIASALREAGYQMERRNVTRDGKRGKVNIWKSV